MSRILSWLQKLFQKTIRSFDDAYVMNDGEFLSCLKHSDNGGGLKFINRLSRILENDMEVEFSMSSIVAEPLPGDSITQLIDGVRNELQSLSSTGVGVTEEMM